MPSSSTRLLFSATCNHQNGGLFGRMHCLQKQSTKSKTTKEKIEQVGGSNTLNSGYDIPMIGIGTYLIKEQSAVNTAIDTALTAGYRLIDTAKRYQNEKEIGNALKECLPKHHLSRSDLFITTKVPLKLDNNTLATRKDVEESLKLLQSTYLDLVLVHFPRSWMEGATNDSLNNAGSRREAYLELEQLKLEGKVRSIGISSFESRHIEELKKYATIAPAVNQCEFHPHLTRNELREYCKKENIFFQAFTSLGRQEPALIEDPVVVGLAKKHRTSVNIVLLAFALSQGVGIVPKSANPTRIRENICAVNVQLSDQEIAQLTALDKNKNYTHCDGWNVL
uniref:NADP-dependent oxidoreductase domain-containing protein n=1 Tax=Plectus sambesii TaxID=2011161 RepID=A0A914WV69_9BILA